MPITINGSGTIAGISAGGLPDNSITTADIAAGAVTQAKRSEQLTLGTAQNSTSGTSIDFTGLPSWVKRVTVMFDGVSGNGTSLFLVQLGDAGGFENTGYESFLTAAASTVSTSSSSAGFQAMGGVAARTYRGTMQLSLLSGNLWVALFLGNDAAGNNYFGSGSKTLSDTLTQVRFTTVNGTDTFDAGSINILYE